MRAIVADAYGEADQVLKLEDVERPTPAEGEVLVRVAAASVNPGDWYVMRGNPYVLRLMGYGLRRPKSRIQGQDVAGIVEAVGAGVTRFQPGDEVVGAGKATFAEFAVLPEKMLQPKPKNLSLEEASTLPVTGLTALHALRDQAEIRAGQKVLIIAAAGGVGQFAVQMAKAEGCEVTGVCSTRNLDRVRELGADRVIDYTAEDFTAGGRQYDVVVRISGPDSVARCRKALKPDGTLVIVGASSFGSWTGSMHRMLGTSLLNIVTKQRLRTLISIVKGEDLAALCELVEKHDIHPSIDRRFPLEEAADALAYVGTGHARGKVVLTV